MREFVGKYFWFPGTYKHYIYIYIAQVVNPTSESHRSNYILSLLKAGHQLSGLNDALAEVPDDYYTWLISHSYCLSRPFLPGPIVIEPGVWSP
jgi:hypothetical protein